MKERRKFIRYKTPGNLCQVFSHKSDIPWRVKDISKSGLAFEHHPETGDMIKLTKIDIVANCPNRFYLIGVPCKAVYDFKEIAESQTFTGTEIKRCGLQYKSLQKRQADNLDRLLDFLRQHF
jgi:hypothetical protein